MSMRRLPGWQEARHARSEVDHRTPRAWFLDGRATGDPDALDNLRAVSSSCHRKISLAQRGFRRRPRIDLNGWPVASITKHSPLAQRATKADRQYLTRDMSTTIKRG